MVRVEMGCNISEVWDWVENEVPHFNEKGYVGNGMPHFNGIFEVSSQDRCVEFRLAVQMLTHLCTAPQFSFMKYLASCCTLHMPPCWLYSSNVWNDFSPTVTLTFFVVVPLCQAFLSLYNLVSIFRRCGELYFWGHSGCPGHGQQFSPSWEQRARVPWCATVCGIDHPLLSRAPPNLRTCHNSSTCVRSSVNPWQWPLFDSGLYTGSPWQLPLADSRLYTVSPWQLPFSDSGLYTGSQWQFPIADSILYAGSPWQQPMRCWTVY